MAGGGKVWDERLTNATFAYLLGLFFLLAPFLGLPNIQAQSFVNHTSKDSTGW